MERGARSNVSIRRRVHPLTWAAIVWGLFVVYGTCLPFDFSGDLSSIADAARLLLRDMGQLYSLPDVVSNVLLFVPWGALLAARALLGGRSRAGGLTAATFAGLSLSVGVEILQLVQPQRTPSILDVFNNTAGAFCGGLLGVLIVRRLWRPSAAAIARSVAARPLACIALVAVAMIVLAGMQPFNVSLDVGDLKASVQSARVVPFGDAVRGSGATYPWWKCLKDLLAWALVGGAVALAAWERIRRSTPAFAAAVVGGGAVAILIEIGQLVMPPRGTDATTVLFALFGSAAGALMAWTLGFRRPQRCWLPALAAWSGMLGVSAWTPPPYALPQTFSWIALVPFHAYYARMDVNAVADLIRESAVMVPFGAFWAFRFPRQRLGVIAAGLVAGSVLEIGQLFVTARTPDITDALTAAIGAKIGWMLWQRGVAARASVLGAGLAVPVTDRRGRLSVAEHPATVPRRRPG